MPKFLTKEYRVSSFIDSGNMPTLLPIERKKFASTITDYEGLTSIMVIEKHHIPTTQQNFI